MSNVITQTFPPRTSDDFLEPVPPFDCTEEEIERWNTEWIRYLGREWRHQLLHHSAYPATPEYPEHAVDALRLNFGENPRQLLALYCDRADLVDRSIMEMGCGCGNMGKLVARYVKHYLGVDFSPMALAVARLVSPKNCTYIQVADRPNLEAYFGMIDTVVGRYFWIHQNARLARYNLEYLANFLKPGGRLYADFYWPNPEMKQGRVYSPREALSKKFPSVTFLYTTDDVKQLVEGTRFGIVREELHPGTQRRYVVFEAQ